MKEVVETAERAAESSAPVYLYGESGTGKEVICRLLHELGPRKDKPWVPVQCGAIPADLAESLFFGHAKGAFTGAETARDGYFAQADGGTLFLDEVDTLTQAMQAKLLRVLEDSKVRPVGSEREIAVSVRIVSASNRDLDRLVADGNFREDLMYRLVVVRIDIPPLRERKGDIPLLTTHFLHQAALQAGIPVPHLGDDVLSIFLDYDWPGNVRQLRNEIDRIVVLLPKPAAGLSKITPAMVFPRIRKGMGERERAVPATRIDEATAQVILETLEKHGGNKSRTARELGLSRNGLKQKMKRLGLVLKDGT
jgi:DNA-binding NtrC family response regulator